MANYYTHFSVMFNPGPQNITEALSLATDMATNPELYGLPYFGVHVERQEDELWLDDDASSDTEGVIAFVKECAARFKLTGRWGFQYCNWCDKPRLDGYGGGVIVIDLGTGQVDWCDTGQVYSAWIEGNEANV